MQVKKIRGKVYGANLTAAEQKAMEIEINRQLAEISRKHELEVDAMVLWELHEQLGFGPKRLKRFFDNFSVSINELISRYEDNDDNQAKLCMYKLKEIGVDIEEWSKEN